MQFGGAGLGWVGLALGCLGLASDLLSFSSTIGSKGESGVVQILINIPALDVCHLYPQVILSMASNIVQLNLHTVSRFSAIQPGSKGEWIELIDQDIFTIL